MSTLPIRPCLRCKGYVCTCYGIGRKTEGLPGQQLDPRLSGRAHYEGGLGVETAELVADRSRVTQRRMKIERAENLSVVCE
jgi:hypothetical protein